MTDQTTTYPTPHVAVVTLADDNGAERHVVAKLEQFASKSRETGEVKERTLRFRGQSPDTVTRVIVSKGTADEIEELAAVDYSPKELSAFGRLIGAEYSPTRDGSRTVPVGPHKNYAATITRKGDALDIVVKSAGGTRGRTSSRVTM